MYIFLINFKTNCRFTANFFYIYLSRSLGEFENFNKNKNRFNSNEFENS